MRRQFALAILIVHFLQVLEATGNCRLPRDLVANKHERIDNSASSDYVASQARGVSVLSTGSYDLAVHSELYATLITISLLTNDNLALVPA